MSEYLSETANELVFMGKDFRVFELENLLSSSAETLGKGTFGYTYVVDLEGRDHLVVVKRFKVDCVSGTEFVEKVELLGKMDHENLLPVRAYCCQKETRRLVYDYMPMGSASSLLHGVVVVVKRLFGDYGLGIEREREKLHALGELVHENLVPLRAYIFSKLDRLLICDYMSKWSLPFHLHGSIGIAKTPLSWEKRAKIAYGVACGVNYLHSLGPTICHGNIRSSNVFLAESYEVSLSEFGIAQLIPPQSKAPLASGYRAPEVTFAHQVSQQGDVYSFGVLLLELLTGQAPSVNLPRWVRSTLQEKPIIEVFDDELKKDKKNGEGVVVLLQVAVCCTFQYPNKRPLMSAVTNQIKSICAFS